MKYFIFVNLSSDLLQLDSGESLRCGALLPCTGVGWMGGCFLVRGRLKRIGGLGGAPLKIRP